MIRYGPNHRRRRTTLGTRNPRGWAWASASASGRPTWPAAGSPTPRSSRPSPQYASRPERGALDPGRITVGGCRRRCPVCRRSTCGRSLCCSHVAATPRTSSPCPRSPPPRTSTASSPGWQPRPLPSCAARSRCHCSTPRVPRPANSGGCCSATRPTCSGSSHSWCARRGKRSSNRCGRRCAQRWRPTSPTARGALPKAVWTACSPISTGRCTGPATPSYATPAATGTSRSPGVACCSCPACSSGTRRS